MNEPHVVLTLKQYNDFLASNKRMEELFIEVEFLNKEKEEYKSFSEDLYFDKIFFYTKSEQLSKRNLKQVIGQEFLYFDHKK